MYNGKDANDNYLQSIIISFCQFDKKNEYLSIISERRTQT